MPRAYTDAERIDIVNKLRKAALDCLILLGVRKTTVDEIVLRVNIPKGTFYLFYKSKELLLFDAVNNHHTSIQNSFIEKLNSTDCLSVEAICNEIFYYFKRYEESQLAKILVRGEFELLIRKVPLEVIKGSFNKDRETVRKLFTVLQKDDNGLVETYEAAFRAIIYTALHKKEIGEEKYDDVVILMIHGLVMNMMR